MLRVVRRIGAAAVPILLSACAAVGVVATSDPAAKLRDAMALFDDAGRPLPAEQLIVDALEQYKASNNAAGLAEAYRVYGLFFRSRSMKHPSYAAHYREKGFLDKTATYDARYDRSLYYLGMAEDIYRKIGGKDMLSNVYFHMGNVNVLKGDSTVACRYYDESLSAQAEFRAAHPDTSVVLPRGTRSFEEALAASKKYAGCP
jgi:hypothetical protein